MNYEKRQNILDLARRALSLLLRSTGYSWVSTNDLSEVPVPPQVEGLSAKESWMLLIGECHKADRSEKRASHNFNLYQAALGKVAILRHENNQLRAKNVPQPSKEVRLSYPEPFYVVGLQGKGTAPVEVIRQCPPSTCIKDLMEDLKVLPETGLDKAVVVVKVNPGARPFILFRNARDDRGWKATNFDGKDQFLAD